MIIFSGQLSGKCKRYVLHRESRIAFIAGIIAAIIFGIPAIIAAITFHWIFFICIPFFVGFPFLAGMPPSKNSYNLVMPSKIIIDANSNIIKAKNVKFYAESSIEEVVKVLDFGDWYHIYVKNKEGRFVCQKNLLTVGTLTEFENLFKDKIIKK